MRPVSHPGRGIGPVVILGAAALAALAAAAPPAAGPYTEKQAAEGGALYAQACALCHGASLEGSHEIPPLKGRFVANWGGAPVGALFDYVHRAMPQNAPGSLSAEDSARIVAYLLKENGVPAGATPLPTDPAALKTIPFGTVRPR